MKDTKSMSTNNDGADEMPTTFQLAQLAATVQMPPPDFHGSVTPSRVMRNHNKERCWLAMGLWDAAAEVRKVKREAEAQASEISGMLLDMPPGEFAARLNDYKGRKQDVLDLITEKTYRTHDVARHLYKDKSITAATRVRLMKGLVDAVKVGMERNVAEADKFKEMLDKPALDGWFVLWLVRWRHDQVAHNKKRFVPKRARRNRAD